MIRLYRYSLFIPRLTRCFVPSLAATGDRVHRDLAKGRSSHILSSRRVVGNAIREFLMGTGAATQLQSTCHGGGP